MSRWTVYDGGDYWVDVARMKETVTYCEAAGDFTFDATWGQPHTVYLPSTASWDRVVPPWLQGRRELVAERLRARSGHVVVDTDTGYSKFPLDQWRLQPPPE